MENEFAQKIIDQLDELLDCEREVLVAGKLDQIQTIMERKEALLDKINGLDPACRPRLGDLQGKAERNRELIEGSLQGIRAVANRLAHLRKVRQSLDTYDQSGRRNSVPTEGSGSLEKRA